MKNFIGYLQENQRKNDDQISLINERFDIKKYSNLIPQKEPSRHSNMTNYSLMFSDEKDSKINHMWIAEQISSDSIYNVGFIATYSLKDPKEFGFISSNSLLVIHKMAAITYNFVKMVQPNEIMITPKNEQLERIYVRLMKDILGHLPDYYIAKKTESNYDARTEWLIKRRASSNDDNN